MHVQHAHASGEWMRLPRRGRGAAPHARAGGAHTHNAPAVHTRSARAVPLQCTHAVHACSAHATPPHRTLEQAPTRDGSVVLGDLASAIFFNLLALLWLRATRAEERAGARRSGEHPTTTSREVPEAYPYPYPYPYP